MTPRSLQLDPRIQTTLAALRRRVRCYIWIQGLAAIVAALGVVFWLSLAADWFFEPSLGVRKFLLAAIGLVVAAVVYRFLGRRVFVPLADRSMAILMERRFPEFDAGLLTAVELTARPPDPNDCNREMLAATCRSAVEPLDRVRLAEVFNLRPLLVASLSALLLAAAAGGFAIADSGSFSVWFRRTVLLSDELWPRRTILTVDGFSGGVAKVARGADFTLVARADMTGEEVPRSVRIMYRPEGASRLDATMIREGQAIAGRDPFQTYSYTFRGVLAPIDLELRGGDASIRDLRIEVVDAPALVGLQAECHYPDYMGREPRSVPVSGVVPVPRGTQVTLRAEANKRLTEVEIVDGETTQSVADAITRQFRDILALARKHTSNADASSTGEERQIALTRQLKELHNEAVRRFNGKAPEDRLRPLLDGLEAVANDCQAGTDTSAFRTVPHSVEQRLRDLASIAAGMVSFTQFNYPLQPLDETKPLELVLHDVDGIKSPQPIRVILSSVEDQPPQPVIQLRGIGSAITPQAKLPFQGNVHDDHGVDKVWLEYAIEGREPRRRTLKKTDTIATNVWIDENFEIADLRLEPGGKILVAVKASDRCNLGPEPNEGSGDRWILDVVTPEKLRAMLEAREIVLRQRFETIVEEVQEIRDTLAALEFGEESSGDDAAPKEAAEPGDSDPTDSAQRRRGVRLLRIQRARQNGQKDSHETAGVAEAFGDIREELLNNRIYTEELRIRLEEDIVAPLSRLCDQDFVQLDERLALLESTHDDLAESPPLRDAAIVQTDTILKTMQQVLSRMIELEDFNEAVQLLRSIIEEQEQLREAIRERRKAKLRQLLED